jgi:hypothetical protein
MSDDLQRDLSQAEIVAAKERADANKEKNKKLSADEFFKIKDSKKKFIGPKATKNSLGDEINKFREMDTRINAKTGGRASFRGGGMCKKGMNKKARGANS